MSQLFTSGGQSIGVSASTSVLPKEHPGLISFRMDWLDLLAVQGTLKSLLQRQSSKASTLQCSAFFIVQLSHPYMTTGTTISLTRPSSLAFVKSYFFDDSDSNKSEVLTCISPMIRGFDLHFPKGLAMLSTFS